MWEGPQMGVWMINTVLFMAVIFCGVWNIVPHRLQQLEKKSRAADAPTLVGVCLYLFFYNSPCVFILFTWTTLAEEERLSKTFLRIVAVLHTASGCGWPLCVWGDHWNLPGELCKSHHLHTASVKTSVRAKIPLSSVIHLSSFCFPVSFHLSFGT